MNARILLYVLLFAVLGLSWLGSCVIYRAAEVGDLVAPLEPRSFDALTVITLGTGNGYENPERRGPSVAVARGERVMIVDAGRGIPEALRLAKIPVSQPDTVLLSNLLPENTLGLDDLILTGWIVRREEPLRVVGPPGTRAFVEGLLATYRTTIQAQANALALPETGAHAEVVEVNGTWTEERDGVRVEATTVPGGPLPGLLWRFEAAGRTIVIGGSGWADDALVEFADGADLLVQEAVYVPTPEEAEEAGITEDPDRLRRDAALHTSLQDVGDLAERAGVGMLLLTRVRPPPFFDLQLTMLIGRSFSGKIAIANDGDEFEL